jgi:hypothetical protein
VNRRLIARPLLLVVALVALLAACNTAPAAPALTDPKEIVTKAVTSLTNVKSLEFTGTFSGTVAAQQMGTFDLSTVKMSGAFDIANKAGKFSLDAPSILGTKIDALFVGNTVYYKVAGAPAMMMGGQSDKYTKYDAPAGSTDDPVKMATDTAKLVSDLQAALAKLPTPPTKAADEKCGDADCYHVTIALSNADLQSLSGGASVDGNVTLDLFTRKQDYRPGKLVVSATSTELGTVGMTLELKYDVGVSVQAPPADQVAP